MESEKHYTKRSPEAQEKQGILFIKNHFYLSCHRHELVVLPPAVRTKSLDAAPKGSRVNSSGDDVADWINSLNLN